MSALGWISVRLLSGIGPKHHYEPFRQECGVPIRRSHRAGSHGRLPNSFDLKRFVRTRPRWHGDADCFEGFITVVSELKLCARRNRDRHSGQYVHSLPWIFAATKATPHPTSSAYEVPNLLDRLVSNRFRYMTRA